MNNFSLTLESKRFDLVVRSRRLAMTNNTERFLYHLAERRGTIDGLILYAIDRKPFKVLAIESSETEYMIEVRWQK